MHTIFSKKAAAIVEEIIVKANTTLSSGYSVENAYQTIRERILSGDLQAGQWLRESDLAQSIGVSRTPVREALRRLSAEGLVLHERNRGVQVQSWSTKDLDEVFGLRSLLEPWGAALAANCGTVDLDYLTRNTDDMEVATNQNKLDVVQLTEVNNLFHRTILEASGNDHLRSIVNSIIQVPLVRRTFAYYKPESLRRSVVHHRELVHALQARDAVWAEATMRAHIHAGWAEIRHKGRSGLNVEGFGEI